MERVPGPDGPHLSVIVPVYRQWDLVPLLLDCLRAQSVGQSAFDVILVDNEPGVPRPSVDLLPPDILPQVQIVPCAAPGSYSARNQGAALARGDWLVFTDADCQPAPGWLAALRDAIRQDENRLYAGPVAMISSARPNAFETYDLLRGIPQERYIRNGYAATANLAVRRDLFAALGGFDATRFSGGDGEFCRRAGKATADRPGYGISLVPAAVVHHPSRSDWAALAVKARRVKGGQLRNGTARNRTLWALRTLTPPFRQTVRFMAAAAPLSARLTAVAVLMRLWLVELAEFARLLVGAPPERR